MRRVWPLSRQQASRRQWDKTVLLKGDVATLMLGMMVRSTGAGGVGRENVDTLTGLKQSSSWICCLCLLIRCCV